MKIKNIGVVLFCLAMISLVSCKAQKERKQIDEYIASVESICNQFVEACNNDDSDKIDELDALSVNYFDKDGKPFEKYTSLSAWTDEDSKRIQRALESSKESYENYVYRKMSRRRNRGYDSFF